MRKAFITALLLTLLLSVACNQDADSDTVSMRITIETTTRTIAPEDYDLDVDSYHVTGSGPDSSSFDVTTTRTAISLDGLSTGTWTLYGEGLNSDGDVLVTGSTEFNLSASNKSATITLDELEGEGTLNLTFSWDTDELSDPDDVELVLTLTDQSDSSTVTLTPVMNTSAGTATYSGTLDSGSYVLSAQLYTNSALLIGIVEAVRIADGETSEGSITFAIDDITSEPGVITVSNSTGSPVELTITGLSSTVTAGSSLTVSLTSDDGDLSDFEIYWYLDGEEIGDGEEVEFAPLIGNHILSAVASSALIGSTSSASISFEAIASGTAGTPVQSILIDTSSGVNLGEDALIEFLYDGRMMIVSNSSQTIQIASLVKNTVTVEKTVSFSTLDFSGSTVTSFAVEYVNSSLYKIALTTYSPFSARIYNFIPSSNTFSLIDETSSITLKNNITGSSTLDEATADYGLYSFVVPDNNEVLYFLTAENGEYADLAHYDYTDGFSSTDKQVYPIGSLFAFGDTPVAYAVNENMAMFANKEGQVAGMSNWSSSTNGGSYTRAVSFSTYSKALNRTDFVSMGLCVTGDYSLYVQTDLFDAWLYYQYGTYDYAYFETDGHQKTGLVSSPDLQYAYYIDQDKNQLVTLYFASESSQPTVLDTLDLTVSDPDSIAVSKSGANIVVFNGSDVSEMEVLRISLSDDES